MDPLLSLSFKGRVDWMSFRHFHKHLLFETQSHIQLCGIMEYLEKLKKMVHRIAEMRGNNALTKDLQKLFPKLRSK